ncbi:hypothetical protein BaRGS_00012545 [Batillaria attramentaria]|uniref:Secreted protein n=1 Tax=Batillaria attramentaria TaxID=370345 RepID=A0ABD0LA92_9CAEN
MILHHCVVVHAALVSRTMGPGPGSIFSGFGYRQATLCSLHHHYHHSPLKAEGSRRGNGGRADFAHHISISIPYFRCGTLTFCGGQESPELFIFAAIFIFRRLDL